VSRAIGSPLRFTADPAMLRFFDPKSGRAIQPAETVAVHPQSVEVMS